MAKKRNAEVIVIGTRPAGATAALELVRRGKKVVLIEKGREDPVGLGVLNTYMNLYDKYPFFSRSGEGVIIDRSITPGGTAAVGKVVDENFETRGIKNLYVCDTSVFPRSPGVPPVLILLAMVKKWVRQLEV